MGGWKPRFIRLTDSHFEYYEVRLPRFCSNSRICAHLSSSQAALKPPPGTAPKRAIPLRRIGPVKTVAGPKVRLAPTLRTTMRQSCNSLGQKCRFAFEVRDSTQGDLLQLAAVKAHTRQTWIEALQARVQAARDVHEAKAKDAAQRARRESANAVRLVAAAAAAANELDVAAAGGEEEEDAAGDAEYRSEAEESKSAVRPQWKALQVGGAGAEAGGGDGEYTYEAAAEDELGPESSGKGQGGEEDEEVHDPVEVLRILERFAPEKGAGVLPTERVGEALLALGAKVDDAVVSFVVNKVDPDGLGSVAFTQFLNWWNDLYEEGEWWPPLMGGGWRVGWGRAAPHPTVSGSAPAHVPPVAYLTPAQTRPTPATCLVDCRRRRLSRRASTGRSRTGRRARARARRRSCTKSPRSCAAYRRKSSGTRRTSGCWSETR